MGGQKQRDRCTCDFSSLVCRSLCVQGFKEWIFWKFYDYLQSYWVIITEKTPVNPFSEFGKGIRNNWKQATLLWCGGLMILFVYVSKG